jgi:sugar (pentulose or hexulose) kinase
MALVLGLDIGTTSTIGIVIETEGAVRAMASRPVRLASPHPGWAEGLTVLPYFLGEKTPPRAVSSRG